VIVFSTFNNSALIAMFIPDSVRVSTAGGASFLEGMEEVLPINVKLEPGFNL